MSALTLRIEPAEPYRADALAAALATLPLSFTGAGNDAEVVAVSGADGWVDRVRAAAVSGARAVIVTDPVPVDPAATMSAGPPACFVVLAETWASSPVLRAAVERFRAPIDRTHLVDARAVEPAAGRDLRTVVFAQLRAVQNLGIGVASLEVVAETPSSILAVGRSASGARVVLSAARSETTDGALDLLLVGHDETIRIDLPGSTTARPGRAVLTSESSATESPTIWQSAFRSSLLVLRDALATGSAPDDLRAFAEATALLNRATPSSPRA